MPFTYALPSARAGTAPFSRLAASEESTTSTAYSFVILLFGFGATLFTFFGNFFLGGLHTYSGL